MSEINRGVTNHLLVFFFYAITIFFVTFPNPSKSQLVIAGQKFTFSTTISEMVERLKMSQADQLSYVKVALELYNHGTVKAQVGALTLWPPGLPFLESLLLRLFGIDHPFILSMTLTTICIWSIVFMLLFSILRMRINWYLALLLPLSVLAFDDFRLTAFRAVLGSDSIACAFFCGSFLVIINAKSHRKMLLMSIISGLFMACAALTRVTYEFVGNFLLIGSMLALFVVKLSRLIKAKTMCPGNLKIVIRFWAGYILIAAIVFSIALIPYKLYYKSLTGEYNLTAKSSYIWALQWMSDQRLIEHGGGWVSDGLGGMACRVEPDLCKTIDAFENSTKTPFNNGRYDEYRRLALKAFFFNPYKWMKIKLSRFHVYWFIGSNNWLKGLVNLALLFFSVFIFITQFLRFVNYRAIVMSYYYLAFLGGCLLPLFIIHYEARYFYPIKMVGIIFTLSLISVMPKFLTPRFLIK